MTRGAQPTGPQALPIQTSKHEVMPPIADVGHVFLSAVRGPRIRAPIPVRQPKSQAETDSLEPGRAEPMNSNTQPKRSFLKRFTVRMAAVPGVIACLAFPVFAQDGNGPVPKNAEARSYGTGWDCAPGFRVDGAACLAIEIPEHAYATGRSYGTGWSCRRGYEEVGEAACEPMPLPANAFLQSTGYGWQCERGYRQEQEACLPIMLPDNAYLTEDPSGSGWVCDRGFAATLDSCIPIAVPENGYLTNADYGAEWVCERGFFEIDGRCDAVELPAKAFINPDNYGPRSRCERGYQPLDNACVAIELPENAHLDRSGNQWSCDRDFQYSGGACVLGR